MLRDKREKKDKKALVCNLIEVNCCTAGMWPKLQLRQEAESHGQSVQEPIYQAKQSRQEARDRGQSLRKPNMTDSLCRKRKISGFVYTLCSIFSQIIDVTACESTFSDQLQDHNRL